MLAADEMAEYRAHILICTNSEGTEDKRHCGDKGGLAVFQAFRAARTKFGLDREVMISKTGCTGQHAQNTVTQTAVIIYGPDPIQGGTWYRAEAVEVEELFREHIINRRLLDRLRNPGVCVALTPFPHTS